MSSSAPGRSGSLARSWWIAGLVAIGSALALLLRLVHLSTTDDMQQVPLVTSLVSGDLVHALENPFAQLQTSGPGFGLFAVPVYAFCRLFLGVHDAFTVASLACLVPLAWATVAVSRATGVAARSVRELAALAVVVLGTPIVAGYVEAWHPADVLATAACLGAVAAVARQRIGWAYLLLGFALVTRQWAIAAVAVLAVLERGDARRHLVLGSLGTAAVIVAPFLFANAGQTILVLQAKDTIRGSTMALSLVELPSSVSYGLSRLVPLVAAAVLCGWLLVRRVAWSPEVALAALAVAFLVRPPLDQAGFLYYAAPGYACFVLLGPRTWRWLAAGAVGSGVLLARFCLRLRFPIADSTTVIGPTGALRLPGAALAVLTTLVFVAALVAAVVHLRSLVRHGAVAGPGAGPSGEGAAGGPVHAEGGDGILA